MNWACSVNVTNMSSCLVIGGMEMTPFPLGRFIFADPLFDQ